MTEATIAEATETSRAAVNLPPGPRLPM
ncbi:MAG: hypothetical protein QOK33_5924, partial [Mycobacterium sp.]|nr:hypothetical protein [Mycobacterium sp.]